VLLAAQGHELENWKGVGVDLADETQFRLAALKEPQTLIPLREMVKEIFGQSEFRAYNV